MRVLAVNAGSSSLKLSVRRRATTSVEDAAADRTATRIAIAALRAIRRATAGEVDAVGHRLVHGGAAVRHATRRRRRRCGAARRRRRARAAARPARARRCSTRPRASIDRRRSSCFDTAFHAGIPDVRHHVCGPGAAGAKWGVRRYGFHGLSYAWCEPAQRGAAGRSADELQVVIAHLGVGRALRAPSATGAASTRAWASRRSRALVMATRSGTVDPGALLWLQEHHGLTVGAMTRVLEHGSGPLRRSAACPRHARRRARGGARRCGVRLALDVYVHVLSRVIGGLATSLDRLDALVFTGGRRRALHLDTRPRVRATHLLGLPEHAAARGR